MAKLVKKLEIKNKLGLHARAAVLLVQTINRFSAEVKITKDGQVVDGRSILGVLTLAAARGSKIRVEADGGDAEEGLRAVEDRKLWELLEQAAGQGEEGRKLYVLAQQIERTNADAREREDLRARLPGAMRDHRAMEYEDRFLRDLQNLQERERQEVIDALQRLAEHGKKYSSLKTKRWEGRPVQGALDGSFQSRSSGEYRFFWKQDGSGIIRFYRVGHHTEFSTSEW